MSETRKPPGSRPGPPTANPSARKAPRVMPVEKHPLDEPAKPTGTRLPPPGKPDTQSRAKAENAAKQADAQQTEQAWPMGVNGHPMARVEFSAAELIPTGQYANVSVGPARITAYIDLGRAVDEDASYFSEAERENLTRAVNELAEMVERDVVAVQRNLVLESIQGQKSTNGN